MKLRPLILQDLCCLLVLWHLVVKTMWVLVLKNAKYITFFTNYYYMNKYWQSFLIKKLKVKLTNASLDFEQLAHFSLDHKILTERWWNVNNFVMSFVKFIVKRLNNRFWFRFVTVTASCSSSPFPLFISLPTWFSKCFNNNFSFTIRINFKKILQISTNKKRLFLFCN